MNKIFPVLLTTILLAAFAGGMVASPLEPGQKTVLPVQLEQREIRWIKSSGVSGLEKAKAAIAVPPDFDPSEDYPVLVTCVTGDRYLSNIEEMDKYWPQAVQEGWVVVTGWGDPHPDRDTKAYRRAVTVAAMRKLAEIYPQSRNWPVAVGGFSGGSKNAPITAAYLQEEGYRIIGLFMGGCNQDLATYALRKISPDTEAFRAVPVFMSTGTSDRVSTVKQSRKVMEKLSRSGFSHLRFEEYDGPHRLKREHVAVALRWFASLTETHSEAVPTPPAQP